MNSEDQDCKWTFLDFESADEGQPVQSWFNSLPEDHRDEVKDRLGFLQVTPRSLWDEPFLYLWPDLHLKIIHYSLAKMTRP